MSNIGQELKEIIPVSIESEMRKSYLDYAMSVIVSRAIPDVRDGLKPVHRRILYAMYEAGYFFNKAHRKSARIVGDVIGKYHPHGDVAVYDSLVRMAQNFSLRLPLIDGQGNFGSIDGDSPAAMRYTESRLAKVADELLNDIDKETVDFQPNYDGSESEPKVLPANFPNILVNGSGGIAVGMATNIPPHNLGELIDACCLYIDEPEADITKFAELVKGPDFPTGGTILGVNGIRSALETGRGSIIIRGKTEIEEINQSQQAIIITEIPYAVNKAKLVERIAELVREKKIEGISDLRDESDRTGIRVVVELKKGIISDVILNQLYSYTSLQTSFGINMLVLNNGLPQVMNLRDIIAAFVEFREEVIIKRTIFLLNKSRDKSHLLVALLIAIKNIDFVINLIKSAKDVADAKEQLMQIAWDVSEIVDLIKIVDDKTLLDGVNCYLSESQARAILDMRLQKLTNLEKDKIRDDLLGLAEEIKGYLLILNSRERLLSLMKEELLRVKDEFATPRKTDIEFNEFEKDIEDLIPKEEMVVTVTMEGYIKRVPLSTYRAQRRGGKGRSGAAMREDDVITQVFVGNTHTPMLFFSNMGQVYRLKLYKLPLGNPQNKGRPIVNILNLREKESITTIMPMPEDENLWDDLNIIFSTAKGNVRRNDLSDFKRIQVNGKIAIRLDEDDSLVGVRVCNDTDHVLLASREGKCIRFPVSAVRVFKSRTSDGIRGMDLEKGDEVISVTILKGAEFSSEIRDDFLKIPVDIRRQIAMEDNCKADLIDGIEVNLSLEDIKKLADNEEFILTVSEKGYGKCTSAYEYRVTNRGGKGISNMIISEKNGRVICNLPVKVDDELMLITDMGKLIRCPLNTIRITGRNTQGVILFRTASDEKVVSAALIADKSERSEDEEAADLL